MIFKVSGHVKDLSNHYSWLRSHQMAKTESKKIQKQFWGIVFFGPSIENQNCWEKRVPKCHRDWSHQFLEVLNRKSPSTSLNKTRNVNLNIFHIQINYSRGIPTQHPPTSLPPTHLAYTYTPQSMRPPVGPWWRFGLVSTIGAEKLSVGIVLC